MASLLWRLQIGEQAVREQERLEMVQSGLRRKFWWIGKQCLPAVENQDRHGIAGFIGSFQAELTTFCNSLIHCCRVGGVAPPPHGILNENENSRSASLKDSALSSESANRPTPSALMLRRPLPPTSGFIYLIAVIISIPSSLPPLSAERHRRATSECHPCLRAAQGR